MTKYESEAQMRKMDIHIVRCTCGRKAYDFADYAVIFEEDKMFFPNSGRGVKANKSKVVCMRPGCHGAKKSSKLFVEKLPRIRNMEYLRIKKEQDENLSKEGEWDRTLNGMTTLIGRSGEGALALCVRRRSVKW
jgi:hypothetical protein